MYDHLENLTDLQAYVANKNNMELVCNFLLSQDSNSSRIVESMVAKVGCTDFVKNACAIDASEGTLDFFFNGYMTIADRVEFYKNNREHIHKFMISEARIEDVSIIETLDSARQHFTCNVDSAVAASDDDFVFHVLQGDLYDVLFEDDQENEYYEMMAGSVACEVIDRISDRFTCFTSKASQPPSSESADDTNHNDTEGSLACFNEGYKQGYAKARADILALIQNAQ